MEHGKGVTFIPYHASHSGLPFLKDGEAAGHEPHWGLRPLSTIEDGGWGERTVLNQVQVGTQQSFQPLFLTSKLSWHCREGRASCQVVACQLAEATLPILAWKEREVQG